MIRRSQHVRALAAIAVIAVLGTAAAVYVLVQQRLRVPLRDVYHLHAVVSAADGVEPGLGQPVRVAGVKVGSISGLELEDGNARITLEIDRDELPRVGTDARAALEPISPLKDMQVTLDPGRSSRALPEGATIPVGSTTVPTGLDDVLSALDADTRDFLTSLLAGLGEGTAGRSEGLRKALRALGPTTAQLRQITDRLDERRTRVSRLVTNLAHLTRAASQDRELASLVASGEQTLRALADREDALKATLTELPPTVRSIRGTLDELGPLAGDLEPTADALAPALERLPSSLGALGAFAADTQTTLRRQVRPLVRESRPMLADLGPAMKTLRAAAPALSNVMRVGEYLVNELAYNPEGDDEGFLFWFPWWFHNYASMFSAQDAHGSAARAMILVNCQQLTELVSIGELLRLAIGASSLCPDG